MSSWPKPRPEEIAEQHYKRSLRTPVSTVVTLTVPVVEVVGNCAVRLCSLMNKGVRTMGNKPSVPVAQDTTITIICRDDAYATLNNFGVGADFLLHHSG